MNPRDAEKLLGGYAAGTLTTAEREALFAAALHDQRLFDALADEEALRQLLADPAARAVLLQDLVETKPGVWERFLLALRRPTSLALAGSVAAVVVTVSAVHYYSARREAAKTVLIAQSTEVSPGASAPAKEQPVERAVVAPRAKPEAAASAAPPARAAGSAVRELESAEPKKEAAGATAPVTARPAEPEAPWSVLLRNAAGEFVDAGAQASFHAGDQVRLRIRPPADGLLHVNAEDGSAVQTLTPPAGLAVKKGVAVTVPVDGALELSGTSGEKSVRIALAPVPPVAAFQLADRAADARAAKPAAAMETVKTKGATPAAPQVIEIHLSYR